jgi:phosphatidylserine/phosphatidylglycerophosphate/cardiolipin synthase-like enzyme
MASYRRQKGIRTTMLGKLGRSLHLSQYLLRDTYLTPVSLLADRDPLSFARDFALDADELTLLIHDKAKAQRAVKALREEEKALLKEHTRIEQEQAKKAASAPAREDKPRPVVQKAPDPGPRAETPPPSPEDTKQEESRSQKTLFDGF